MYRAGFSKTAHFRQNAGPNKLGGLPNVTSTYASQILPVGQALRRAKDAVGETNQSLAQKSGVPEHTVAKNMSGATQSPSFEQVAAMAAVLGLDLNALAGFQPPEPPADAAVAQARLDGAQELNQALRDRDALYAEGIRQRNLAICVLLGFLAFVGVAFMAYVALDIRDPQHGFIRSGTRSHWMAIALPLGLSSLVAGRIYLSRRIRRTRKEIPVPNSDTEK